MNFLDFFLNKDFFGGFYDILRFFVAERVAKAFFGFYDCFTGGS